MNSVFTWAVVAIVFALIAMWQMLAQKRDTERRLKMSDAISKEQAARAERSIALMEAQTVALQQIASALEISKKETHD